MNNNTFCVIMAGGIGTRFWPMSRVSMPKQFLDILGTGKSFIRTTYERFLPFVPTENFLVVTNNAYKNLVLEHIPELNESQVLCEPFRRNTAPCIAYAAYSLQKANPNAKMIVTPSDHLILNEVDFHTIVNDCLEYADANNVLMTVGIRPSRPETGYGYIQKSSNDLISRVKCFTEKPNLELAQTFVECGEFFWNSGIFIWTVDSIIKAFEKHLPEHHSLFSSIVDDLGTEREEKAIEQVFSECKSISVDYGIMEKCDKVKVIATDMGWNDVGSWDNLGAIYDSDERGNIFVGDHVAIDTRNCITYSNKRLISTVGVDNLIIVETDDAILVCDKNRAQDVKLVVDRLKADGRDELL